MSRNYTATEKRQLFRIGDFMTRVNKLTLGRSTSHDLFGHVTLIKSADHTRGYNVQLDRTGYGTRRFSVAGSKVISNGSYTLGGLRKALKETV